MAIGMAIVYGPSLEALGSFLAGVVFLESGVYRLRQPIDELRSREYELFTSFIVFIGLVMTALFVFVLVVAR